MRNYRNLFEEAFSSSDRVYEIKGPGLSLGVKELSPEETLNMLFGKDKNTEDTCITVSQKSVRKPASGQNQEKKEALARFIQNEKEHLLKLRDVLTGKAASEVSETEALLDFCDYLWAHFPECAGTGRKRPPATDLSFLKRIRIEIDQFLKLWEITLEELTGGQASHNNS